MTKESKLSRNKIRLIHSLAQHALRENIEQINLSLSVLIQNPFDSYIYLKDSFEIF